MTSQEIKQKVVDKKPVACPWCGSETEIVANSPHMENLYCVEPDCKWFIELVNMPDPAPTIDKASVMSPPHPYEDEIALMELLLAGNRQNLSYCEVEGVSDASALFFRQRGQRMQTILDLLRRQERRADEDENKNQQTTVDTLVQDT